MAKNLPHVDTDALSQRITRTPFPGSRKVYLDGSSPDIRVPFREITLGDTLVDDGAGGSRREPNPPLRVYDASARTPTRRPRSTSPAACRRCVPRGSPTAPTQSRCPASAAPMAASGCTTRS